MKEIDFHSQTSWFFQSCFGEKAAREWRPSPTRRNVAWPLKTYDTGFVFNVGNICYEMLSSIVK